MKRLLILGIAITAFAFSLFLMNCGPAANTNRNAESPDEVSDESLESICGQNPTATDLRNAIEDKVMKNGKLKNHYNKNDRDHSSIDFDVMEDGKGGFILLLQGDLAHHAFESFRRVVEKFIGQKCIAKVRFVPRGYHLENTNNANTRLGGQPFEWSLVCEDPNHPCADGSCAAEGSACPNYKDNTNTGNANANMPANGNRNTNP